MMNKTAILSIVAMCVAGAGSTALAADIGELDMTMRIVVENSVKEPEALTHRIQIPKAVISEISVPGSMEQIDEYQALDTGSGMGGGDTGSGGSGGGDTGSGGSGGMGGGGSGGMGGGSGGSGGMGGH